MTTSSSSYTQQSQLVFVDIDGTLVSPPTVWYFFRFCLKNKIIPKRSFLYATYQFLRNHFNRFNHTQAVTHWLSLMNGLEASVFKKYCEQTFEEEIRQKFIPTMLNKIEEHQQQGDLIIIISSTIQCFAETICELLKLDDYSSLEVILNNNRLTHEVIKPMPYHQGKVYYAEQHAKKFNLDLQHAFFYSDSISDLPLLERVGHPVAINPDRYLRKKAIQQNWLIIDDNQRVDIRDYLSQKKCKASIK